MCTDASAQDAPAIATTGFVLGGVNPPPYPATFGAIIGWQDARNGDLDIYARRDGGDRRLGGAWDTVAVAICTATGTQTDVSVAGSDPRGAAAFAWVDRRNGDADIYAAHVDSTGAPTWAGDGNPVCTAAGDQTDVRIFPLLDGGFLLCWLDGRAAPALYAARLGLDGTLAPGFSVDGNPVCVPPAVPASFRAVVDESGGLLVAWTDARAGANGDVYAQKMLADGSRAPGWAADGAGIATGSHAERAGDVASDGQAGLYVVWEDERADPGQKTWNVDIYAQRLTGDANVASGWSSGGVAMCADPSGQRQVRAVATQSSRGILAVWADDRDPATGPDLLATKLAPDASRPPGWSVGGNHVSSAADVQELPELVADARGGALIAWVDYRDRATRGADVYATNINLFGVSDATPRPNARTAIAGPWPTPTRHGATLALSLARGSRVVATILDPAGRVVRTVLQRELTAGLHPLSWDGRDEAGVRVSPGLYFFRVRSGEGDDARRVVMLD